MRMRRWGGIPECLMVRRRGVATVDDAGCRPGACGTGGILAFTRWCLCARVRPIVWRMGGRTRCHHDGVSQVAGVEFAQQQHTIPV